MKKTLLLLSVLMITFVSFASGNKEEVNVYTHRHYEADQALFDKFTEETGITVNVVKAKADQLIERLASEGENSPADILITADAGRLVKADSMGLLKSVNSDVLNSNIPANLRNRDGKWYGFTKRARVVVYNPTNTDVTELSTYEGLTEDKWAGKILVRSSSNLYNQSLLASIISHKGDEEAKVWAEGIVKNFARDPKGNDRDQMKALVAGEGELAIVNTYYLGLLLNSSEAEEVKVGEQLAVFFPNQGDRGTHINISGAGVTKSSKNTENAIKLLEYLSSVEAQEVFSSANYEYPVNPAAKTSDLLKSWGDFKEDNIDIAELGINNSEAVKVFDRAGWR